MNLKVVWAEFSTLSLAVWESTAQYVHIMHATSSRVEHSVRPVGSRLSIVVIIGNASDS